MKTDFAAKIIDYHDNRPVKGRLRRLLFIGLIAISIAAGGVYLYKKGSSVNWPNFKESVFGWMHSSKTHIEKGIVAVKQIAVDKKFDEPHIHFEFYQSLPSAPLKKNTPSNYAVKSLSAPALPSPPAAVAESKQTPAMIAAASDLEHDLSTTIKLKDNKRVV